jgi:hypothetical protein
MQRNRIATNGCPPSLRCCWRRRTSTRTIPPLSGSPTAALP